MTHDAIQARTIARERIEDAIALHADEPDLAAELRAILAGLEPRRGSALAASIEALPPVEREIALRSCTLLVERLATGVERIGRWNLDDGRDLVGEALEETADCLHYLMAEMLRRKRLPAPLCASPHPRWWSTTCTLCAGHADRHSGLNAAGQLVTWPGHPGMEDRK